MNNSESNPAAERNAGDVRRRRKLRPRVRASRTGNALERLEQRHLLATLDPNQALVVEANEWAEISGLVFDDLNGNQTFDYHSSDGKQGTVIYGDTLDIDWNSTSLGATVDDNQSDQVYRGSSAISADISLTGNRGFKFTYVAGSSLPQTGIDSIRFFAQSDTANTKVRLFIDGTLGTSSLGNISVSDSGWAEIDIPLSPTFDSVGDIEEIQFLFSNSSTPYKVYVDEVTLLGPANTQNPAPVSGSANWGTNLFAHEDYTADAAFANVTRTLRRWGNLESPWMEDPGLTYGPQGIPLAPSAAVMYLRGYEPGIYQLRYEGTGEIDFRMGQGVQGSIGIVPGSLRTEGTETVAEVEITSTGGLMTLRIEANDVNDPIQNLQLLAPGYHGASAPTFRNEFLDRLHPFSTLRFMDYSVTNNSDVTVWALRRLPTDSIQTSQLASGDRGGVAWELLIEMANAAQVHAWINVPHLADANYVTQLARLWRDNLDPNLKLIVEYSNEVWNPAFSQYNETGGADYAGVVGPKLVELRQAFDTEWGAERNRVEIVLAGQAANQFPMSGALSHIQTFVDQDVNDAYVDINDVISAISVAMYANVDLNTIYDNLNETMLSLLDMTEERQYLEVLSETTTSHGLKMYAYEAGQHLRTPQTAYPELVDIAQSDPRMALVQAALNNVWQSFGGDLFMHYTFTGDRL